MNLPMLPRNFFDHPLNASTMHRYPNLYLSRYRSRLYTDKYRYIRRL